LDPLFGRVARPAKRRSCRFAGFRARAEAFAIGLRRELRRLRRVGFQAGRLGGSGRSGAMIAAVIDLDALTQLQASSLERAGPGLRESWPAANAMNTAELGQFLDAHLYCVLATATSRGRPLARPVSFLILDATVWLATVDGARLRNLRRTPWVSIVVSDGDRDAHQAVVIDGSVRIVAAAPDRVRAAWAARHGSAATWADAWCEVDPERLLSYDASKSR
jgi:nitroimidazol reductase NimA-like FMN-containing flavoprotein (pyridoxamine 5'-phosphate oxidase superfamily)